MKNLLGILLLVLPISAFANVSFYGQCNYKGPSVELGVGEYSTADLKRIGIPDNAIAALKVPEGFTVTLHENDGFSGRYGTLEKSDACLDNNGFNNLVSSVKIQSAMAVEGFGNSNDDAFGSLTLSQNKPAANTGQLIEVFTDCRYQGKSAKLPIGDYNLAQLRKYGLGNNDISSVKVPEGMSVTVYENDFLRGDSASASENVHCIDTGSFANRITSLSVLVKEGASTNSGSAVANPAKKVSAGAAVYTECDYRGTFANLREGEYNNAQLNELGINNNTISAIQVADGYQVELFINDFQRGTSGTLDTDNPCLVGRYNDAISSVVVTKKANITAATPAATMYVHCNYRGGNIQLPVGRYDQRALKDLLVSDNTVSSIKLAKGYTATVFDGSSFNGNSVVLNGDDDCLDNDDMNEKMSSLIIEKTSSEAGGASAFVAQPNQSNTSKSDDLIASLTCVQSFVEKNVCNEERWPTIERRCNIANVDELSDGYLEGHVNAGNCNSELWDELVRRTANPHLR